MKRLVVIDTETGGLDDREHSILSLGAAIWTEEGVLDARFHMYVHEEELFTTPDALRVNGLTEQMVKEQGMSPSFVVSTFEQWLHDNGVTGRATLAGHNIAGFDMGFLKRLYKLAGKRLPFDYHVVDTMSIALALRFAGRLETHNVKLDTLCSRFGIKIREEGTKHNASEDALATAKLLTVLFGMLSCSGCGECKEG